MNGKASVGHLGYLWATDGPVAINCSNKTEKGTRCGQKSAANVAYVENVENQEGE